MKNLLVQIKVLHEKRLELSQTVSSLIPIIRSEHGCRSCKFFQSVESENEFILLEEWECGDDLKDHMRSASFKVLKGVLNLSEEPHGMHVFTVSQPGRTERLHGQSDLQGICG